jgi:hypothetical protein
MPDVESEIDKTTHSAADAPGPEGEDPLAHLFRMSTTSVAGQEYVAINPTSIVALLLGVASVLALVADVMLIIPLAGVICAIVAIVQIRRSSGTQTGRSFAIAGLVVALLIGGARAGQEVAASVRDRRESQNIAAVIERFGQGVHAARYDEIYDDLTTQAFRERVDRSSFAVALQQVQNQSGYGQLDSIEWNQQRMPFQEVGTSGNRLASAMGIMKFRKSDFVGRPVFTFSNREGTWKIDSSSMFVEKKRKRDQE